MTKRSRAREVALQLLFQHDFNTTVERTDIERFVKDRLRGDALQNFCLNLYDGVRANQKEIDRQLSQAAENWSLHRMPAVDRNLLRLGAYELLHSEETPAPVVMDEAIELAKRYGSKESASFVNGVLDQLRRAAVPTDS